MHKPEEILKQVFGYTSFRSVQKEIVENIIAGIDTLAVMPTGGGKSLCYQIPSLIFPGLTIVISPLISLMKDQIDELTELGIAAGTLNSSMDYEEYLDTVGRVKAGELKLLYLAPETLMQKRTLALISAVKLSLLAVDEAHCISEWGHDFRPEYRLISQVRLMFPKTACLALTATATVQVRKDIAKILNIDSKNHFVAGFDRPNLFIEVLPKTDAKQQLLDFIGLFPEQSGIVYCFSRRQVDELTAYLKSKKIKALPYHAGLSDAVRIKNQEAFRRDRVPVIVATVAFGMGINKPDIRFILHFDLPQNIESYYQQIGRAGRDGLNARCRSLYSHSDIAKVQYIINQKSESEKRIASSQLQAILDYMDSRECRRKPLLTYFNETNISETCNSCDNCISPPPPENDHTKDAQKFLSCMVRMNERYGPSLITDILRGSKSVKVKNSGGDKIPTYGVGKNLSKNEWMSLFRKLVSKGAAEIDPEFGTAKLTETGSLILKGEQGFYATIHTGAVKAVYRKKEISSSDNKLFEILRHIRRELAEEEGVPPYVIFPDKTLIEMTHLLPRDHEELLLVHGVGRVKLERFGNIFLKAISEYSASGN